MVPSLEKRVHVLALDSLSLSPLFFLFRCCYLFLPLICLLVFVFSSLTVLGGAFMSPKNIEQLLLKLCFPTRYHVVTQSWLVEWVIEVMSFSMQHMFAFSLKPSAKAQGDSFSLLEEYRRLGLLDQLQTWRLCRYSVTQLCVARECLYLR